MIFAYYAAAAVQARQQRAVELSACDLAGDEEYPLQGKRGGRYKLVGNRKVYKPGGGGGGAKPAPGGKKAASQKKGSGKQDRAVVTPRVGKALEQLKDLYAVVHEETTGYGAIDEMATALEKLSRDEVTQIAKGFNLAFRKGASKKALVGEIRRKLTERKGSAQRIASISAVDQQQDTPQQDTPQRDMPLPARQKTVTSNSARPKYGSMDRKARVQRLSQQLKNLYAVVHEETTGFGAIDEMVDALGRLSRDEVAQVAKGFNLAFRKGASKNALVGEIKRKLTEQKAIAQRIAPISAR